VIEHALPGAAVLYYSPQCKILAEASRATRGGCRDIERDPGAPKD
jgi:hypothetical protein